jgi:hypothetical protein
MAENLTVKLNLTTEGKPGEVRGILNVVADALK